MKKCNRHLPGRGHVFLVLMLVFSSIVPGAMHAAAMAESAASGGVHHIGNGASADHSMVKHHQGKDFHSAAVQDQQQTDHSNMQDQCCPMSCSSALCSVEPLSESAFIPDNFETIPLLGLVVSAMALPERPPRA